MNIFSQLFSNPVLITAMAAWLIGQFLKFPLDYILNRRWNWGVLLSPGGMPSSHSAMATATTLSIGFFEGFNSALFGLAVAVAMIVIYDATGVRRQAGIHARVLNEIMQEIFAGRPVPEKKLREVLGHTPVEAISGIILGIVIAMGVWLIFPKA